MSKRKVLSVKEKVEIIQLLEKGAKNVTICKQFGLSSSTVSTLLKNKECLMKAYEANVIDSKRLKKCEKDDLDQALLKWFIQQRNSRLPITGPIMKIQAEKFADQLGYTNFSCSNGWLHRFKQRHNICAGKIIGEAASVDDKDVTDWLNTVWKDLRGNYAEENIYNADEAGLFYNLTPHQTLKFKGEKCVGGKLQKDRLTVLLCCNMSGNDKKKLFVVGKSAKPRCFSKVKCLPVTYRSNKKAWMTSELFASFLHEWDKALEKERRKIALIIDNCTAHPNVHNLKNIKLVFLPPNTTSVLQPLDQGIIRSFKCHYRKQFILLKLARMERKEDLKISVLDAIRLMTDAWGNVTQLCIQNCFKKAKFIETSDEEFEEEDDLPLSVWLQQKEIKEYNDVLNIDEFINVDDDVLTSGITSSEDIIAEIKAQEKDDQCSDSDVEEETFLETPTNASAVESLENLGRFFEGIETTDDETFNALSVLRRKLNDAKFCKRKQSTLDYFFTSK